jgi:hypothetical protein
MLECEWAFGVLQKSLIVQEIDDEQTDKQTTNKSKTKMRFKAETVDQTVIFMFCLDFFLFLDLSCFTFLGIYVFWLFFVVLFCFFFFIFHWLAVLCRLLRIKYIISCHS